MGAVGFASTSPPPQQTTLPGADSDGTDFSRNGAGHPDRNDPANVALAVRWLGITFQRVTADSVIIVSAMLYGASQDAFVETVDEWFGLLPTPAALNEFFRTIK